MSEKDVMRMEVDDVTWEPATGAVDGIVFYVTPSPDAQRLLDALEEIEDATLYDTDDDGVVLERIRIMAHRALHGGGGAA